MKAVLFEARERIACGTVDDPRIEASTDAVVRVTLSGVCGSDLHVYHGRESGLDAGTVMGHEFVGEVVETGSRVESFQSGDRVMSPFSVSCGVCADCRDGLTARCRSAALFGWVENGDGLHGGQAEYVRVPHADATLVPLPEALSEEEGLLLGDNLSTGFFCAELAQVRGGGVYLVLGCGAVGLLAIHSARAMGADRIYAYDPIASRQTLAASFGAIPIAAQADVVQTLHEGTEGRGADAVLEVVGSPAAQRLAFDALRPGGTIAAVGVHTAPGFAFSPAEAYEKNVSYRTGRCSARHLMDRLVPVVTSRRLPVDQIITHRMALDDSVEAYRLFAAREDGCAKVVLRPR